MRSIVHSIIQLDIKKKKKLLYSYKILRGGVLPNTSTQLVPEYFCFIPEQSHPIFYFLLNLLYCTTYNTAHAASRLWRYSSIYMNPSQAA